MKTTSEVDSPEETVSVRILRNERPDSNQRVPEGRMQNDLWVAFMTIRQQRMLQEMANRGQIGRNFNMQRIMGINTGITPRMSASTNKSPSAQRSVSRRSGRQLRLSRKKHEMPPDPPEPPYTIRQNKGRLLYYVQETNEGKGFIKELCYSADGRIVCSPFGRGMRLLALNENCTEISECITKDFRPTEMVEIGQSLGIHDDLVVSSKFSPRQHLLVTGCLAGKIVWYMPFSGESLY
ncbi:DDB1- and CUL4-associated factor 10 [Eumeta japonica]|uniref:DDB1-and CUL4-associated factor 10 n=1 Tax=Eumeta variegata TaxID=151549 RepID=A0A4C1W7F1_EUMVA|nr:DDB1- and CUL4-associated factor 10 [Eumeta japonica]